MPQKLSTNTSVYLDFLRLAAALAVFLHHAKNFVAPKLPGVIAGFGGEAVAVFFVLSGFVICMTTAEKETNLSSYAVARLARVYPVAIIALFVIILCDTAGNYINSSRYFELNQEFHFYVPISILSFLSYLFFLNQIWFSHAVFGTGEPYWSLGFEVWYYVLFGAGYFLRGNVRLAVVIAIALICGPKILIYFPLWLIGCIAYKATIKVKMPANWALILYLCSAICLMLVILVLRRFLEPAPMYETQNLYKEFQDFAYFNLIGIFTGLNIVAFHLMMLERAIWSAAAIRWIRWGAGASFTLYLVHQPCLVLVSAAVPGVVGNIFYGTLALIVILFVVLGLAELAERRKYVFKSLITTVFSAADLRLNLGRRRFGW